MYQIGFIFSVGFANLSQFPSEEFSSIFNTTDGCFDDPNAPRCSISNGICIL